MKLLVNEVTLRGSLKVETPDQDVYALYPCPICKDEAHLQLVAAVQAGGKTSLESVWCARCRHRYHRKFPRTDWLEEYYAEKFVPSGRPLPPAQQLGNNWYRRLRRQAGTLVRFGLSRQRPNRINDFCFGVTRPYGYFWKKNERVRKVLEIGCGMGENLAFFRDAGYETYGTECNRQRQAACRAIGLNVAFSDIDNLGCITGFAPFDFVYSTHVLEHILDVNSHIRQVAELTAEDGFLYIETPDLSGEWFVPQTHTICHVHTFTIHSMLTLLRNHGFVPMRCLVDNNIQVLAQKRPDAIRPEAQPAEQYSVAGIPEIQRLRDCAPGMFAMSWGGCRTMLKQLPSDRVVYQTPLIAFEVQGPRVMHDMLCTVADTPAQPLLPLEFEYPNLARPPMWFPN
ncbi:hypothetical protein AYO44_15415 [Planctomycetaceae bacterium SCGC AG-212-F19]|nr:hypothetical protein AYO44_15415 [Planctomycetaceae bacterium SCGC AG-212-F19]